MLSSAVQADCRLYTGVHSQTLVFTKSSLKSSLKSLKSYIVQGTKGIRPYNYIYWPVSIFKVYFEIPFRNNWFPLGRAQLWHRGSSTLALSNPMYVVNIKRQVLQKSLLPLIVEWFRDNFYRTSDHVVFEENPKNRQLTNLQISCTPP